MSNKSPAWRGTLIAFALSAALPRCQPYDVCAPVSTARLSQIPTRLSATGLYADVQSGTIAPGVLAFRPTAELWSDGAAKRRWILLPPGAVVDTADMDDWRLPQGTRLWKEFSRDGVRVETRMIEKVGPEDDAWAAVSYVWTADQRDAVSTPAGASNVLGTEHDVPAAELCVGCHGGRKSFALGFSAMQLSHTAEPGEVDLDTLSARGLLSAPPSAPFVVPGTATEREALGYLHANCAHCHNPARPAHEGPRCYDPRKALDFRLVVSALGSVGQTPAYRTGAGHAFRVGDPDHSKMIELVSRRGAGLHMPPLATERVDEHAVQLLRAWIAAM